MKNYALIMRDETGSIIILFLTNEGYDKLRLTGEHVGNLEQNCRKIEEVLKQLEPVAIGNRKIVNFNLIPVQISFPVFLSI